LRLRTREAYGMDDAPGKAGPRPAQQGPASAPTALASWGIASALLLATFLFFLPTRAFEFVEWDDQIEVENNAHIEGLDGPHLRWMFTNFDYVRRYQPLTWVGWAIDYRLHGRNPSAYHLGNVLQHALCVALLFFVLRRLLRLLGTAPWGELACAAAGALWWGLHPLRAEPVAWVTGRTHTQCAMLLLGMLLAYLYSADDSLGRRTRRACYWLSVLLFLAALLSYAVVVGAALVVVVLDAYPLRRFPGAGPGRLLGPGARRVWLEKLPFLATALGVGLVTLWARAHASAMWGRIPSLEEFSLIDRLAQALYTLAYFLWIPFTSWHLSPVYSRLLSFSALEPVFIVSAAIVLGASALSIATWRRWPWVGACWSFHAVMLAPMLGLTERPHYTSDRYAHESGLWMAALLSGLLFFLWRRYGGLVRVTSLAAMAALVASLAVVAYPLQFIWRNPVTLYEHMLTELGDEPYRADIATRLGAYLLHFKHDRERAVRSLNDAIRVFPQYREPYRHLAVAMAQMGRDAEAASLLKALDRPDDLLVQTTLGRVASHRGDAPEAARRFRAATQLSPKDPALLLELSRALRQAGDREGARRAAQEALVLDPASAPARALLDEP
jgi:protein O-mannosyl-transferase